jgi:hypothetical protein
MRAAAALCTAIAAVSAVPSAGAVVRHHHHHPVVRHVIVRPPQPVVQGSDAGKFGGLFETGILGPTTADPYGMP